LGKSNLKKQVIVEEFVEKKPVEGGLLLPHVSTVLGELGPML
jgi:hypothetical protein